MTPTHPISPEERVRAIYNKWPGPYPAHFDLVGEIIAAIREAENAAYERAAEALKLAPYEAQPAGSLGFDIRRTAAMERILSLRHKEEE